MPGPVNPLAPGVQVTNNGIEVADGTNVRATLGKLPDGTYGLLIYNGAIELVDQFGQTIMSNGAFTGPMIDFIHSGIYNNMFVAGTPGALTIGTSRDDATGHTDRCPGWTAWRSSGTATATVVASTAWPGGQYVQFAFAAVGTSTTNNVALTSDLFPVEAGYGITLQTVEAWNQDTGAGSVLNLTWSIRFYTAAGVFISAATVPGPTGLPALGIATYNATSVPLTARFARLEMTTWETAFHSAANYYRVGSVGVDSTQVSETVIGDSSVAGTLSVGANAYITGSAFVTGISSFTGGATLGSVATSYVGFYGASIQKPTVTGAKAGNLALTSLLNTLANLGLINNSTT